MEDGIDCPLEEEELVEEEDEYDALNDETFGSEATAGDWEQDHEKLAQITELTRPHHQSASGKVCFLRNILLDPRLFKQIWSGACLDK